MANSKETVINDSRSGSGHPQCGSAGSFATNWLVVVLIVLAATVLLGMVWGLHIWKGIPVGKLVRDPVTVADVPIYYGFLSQLGLFIWAATAAVALFSYLALSTSLKRSELARFFLFAGCLTLLLGFDDAFLLHEQVLPRVGLSEHVAFVGYALLMIYFLTRFYPTIWRTDFALLVLALISFGLSIVVDAFELQDSAGRLLEDGAKLVGMMSWLGYFAVTGLSVLKYNELHRGKLAARV